MKPCFFLTVIILAAIATACAGDPAPAKETTTMSDKPALEKSDAEWRAELTAEEYRVLRQKGTERAFTGEFVDHKAAGVYVCAGCGLELFGSAAKFNSGTGWPSYYQPVNDASVAEHLDTSHGMVRREVVCARCGGHLGHVFEDGPEPTGLRYCINSVSLDFKPAE